MTVTPNTENITTVSECGSYIWSVDGLTYNESGIYTVSNGCSTEILDLTINPVPTAPSVVNNGDQLVATADPNFLGVWVDCNTQQPVGTPPMPAQFSPSAPGLYTYVSIDPTTFCFSPGNCVEFISGLEENNISLDVYPNPAFSNFTIETTIPGTVSIIDLNGKVIKSFGVSSGKTNIVDNELTSGTYLVNFKSEEKIETLRLIIVGK